VTPRLPPLLERLRRLREARRALAQGDPGSALEALRDPSTELSTEASALRAEAVDELLRRVVEHVGQGRADAAHTLLTAVEVEDPDRAQAWRQRLEAGGEPGADPAPAPEGQSALLELVAEMRAAAVPQQAESTGEPAPLDPGRIPVAPRFVLAVDDGGEFMVACGVGLVVGHASAGAADVPILGDLEPEHALFEYSESFHQGPRWQLRALSAHGMSVGGRPVGQGAREVVDGDLLQLSEHVLLRFHRPEESSSTALLELLHGAEAEGATRVLLLVPGEIGRIRIGPHEGRHVPVPGLEHEAVLALVDHHLEVRCEGGVRLACEDGNREPASTNKEVPCPPSERVDLTVNARPSQRLPFGLTLRPLAQARRGAAGSSGPDQGPTP